MPLYRSMALSCREWDTKGNLGLVVGATVPEQLGEVRAACPDMPLLIPGVGAQGGDLEAAVRQGADSRGRAALINSSRGIIYASSGADFAQAAAREADKLRTNINEVLEADGKGWS
jgi:orotidine-5'-phosphate decarboxylase